MRNAAIVLGTTALLLGGCIPPGGPATRAPRPATPAAERPVPLVAGTVRGTVAYRERIALLPDARVEVDLIGPDGVVLARSAVVTDGLQVPIGFTLPYRAPAGTALRLDARIVDGQGRRLFALPQPESLPADRQAALILRAARP